MSGSSFPFEAEYIDDPLKSRIMAQRATESFKFTTQNLVPIVFPKEKGCENN